MASLSDRLKSLGVKVGARDLPPAAHPDSWSIDKVVDGEFESTAQGEVFFTTQHYRSGEYHHGRISFEQIPEFSDLLQAAGIPVNDSLTLSQFLFLDTETSGLAGGTGTYAFLVGLGWFDPSGFTVRQYFMRDPGEEEALLSCLERISAPFEALVTFNGKSFDIPLLNTRFTLYDRLSPYPQKKHADLLHIARRVWKARLPSRTLGELERQILDVFREQDEVPGYLVPQYYFDYLRSQDARPLKGVFYHNCLDIVSLAALFLLVADVLRDPLRSSLPALDLASIASMHEGMGHLDLAAELYERCIGDDLPVSFYSQTLMRFAEMLRRSGETHRALHLWEKAAQTGEMAAYENLAKFYEHEKKDPEAALDWTRRALSSVDSLPLPRYKRIEWLNTFNHRAERLIRKSGRSSNNQ